MDYDAKQLKEEAVGMLAAILPDYHERLRHIDQRLYIYVTQLTETRFHNMYEVLGALKFLRMLDEYPFDIQTVWHRFRLYEGKWQDGKYIEHSGGLLFSGLAGRTHYRLTPIQCFMLAGVYGFRHWVDTGQPAGSRPLLPTEEERNGTIWDSRRLVNEAVFFIPRKFGKTTIGAFFQFEGFFFGDYNFEGYCCANSADQAKIIFNMAFDLIHQLDPDEKRIRFTATEINWKRGQPRAGKIVALSAGGKTKDGLFAQYCSSDEYGSATYVNEHSDMASLVNVVEGSMGPRREPLTIHTTTAGNSLMGPFQIKLDAIKDLLRTEVTATPDSAPWQFAVILQPDEWEMDNEALFTDEDIWRKVNPHIGITVQPDYYRKEIAKSRLDPEKRKETITKLFNVFQSGAVTEWIKPERIRQLQTAMRVDDCDEANWVVYAGMDFSQGCDLHAVTYLCMNLDTLEFFADMDAWVTEETLESVSISELYKTWVEAGWLHVSPGAVLQPSLPVNRIIELNNKGVNFIAFGYDSYQSKEPILLLKEWLFSSLGIDDPDAMVVPVSQTFASYNPAVIKAENCIKCDPPLLHFSMNPMWPWEFGCCQLETDVRMNNRKPLKRNPGSDACKVDHVQALCTGFILEEMFEGKIS